MTGDWEPPGRACTTELVAEGGKLLVPCSGLLTRGCQPGGRCASARERWRVSRRASAFPVGGDFQLANIGFEFQGEKQRRNDLVFELALNLDRRNYPLRISPDQSGRNYPLRISPIKRREVALEFCSDASHTVPIPEFSKVRYAPMSSACPCNPPALDGDQGNSLTTA